MASAELTIAASARLKKNLAPGTRITARGEEWVVRSCSREPELENARVIKCEGVSGFLRGVSATFIDAFDHIEIVDPLDIDFVVDQSRKFRDAKLWIDVWARKVVPVDGSLAIGHRAVVDTLPFQRVPAAMALDATRSVRPRILIADAVGLGKTIEVGILLAELIKRGRGKRILVVVLKSMMTQFQREIWTRFGIALTAVDSAKLQSIRREIPLNMNPLAQLDRVIISMDTLKTKVGRQMLESSSWDVVVIDECHNVARRGGAGSQRSQLAAQLARISDAMILTSATPHDGTAASYASLLELLDPLLVVDPDKITKSDLAPVTIQRYAKDVRLEGHKLRMEHQRQAPLDKTTLTIIKALSGKVFGGLGETKRRTKDSLFRTTLCKMLMSSPEAFISMIDERLKKIQDRKEYADDVAFLNELKSLAAKSPIATSPKFRELLVLLKDEIPKKSRVVIFTESRTTQIALANALAQTLSLKISDLPDSFDNKAQIVAFHGGQSEALQQEILEDFQTKNSKIKLLIATDVASEGVNLHYHCSHLVHYDIPWSLITICQRNGRIDRYGQEKTPEIYYLVGHTDDSAAARMSEKRVVEILVNKARHAQEHLGNVGIALGVYDATKEEEKIAASITSDDPLESLFTDEAPEISQTIEPQIQVTTSDLWRPLDHASFLNEATQFLELTAKRSDDRVDLALEEDTLVTNAVKESLKPLARELDLGRAAGVAFASRTNVVTEAIKEARAKAGKWPDVSLGWEIHPTIETLASLVEARFSKKEARILTFASPKGQEFLGFLVYRALYDHDGHPLICRLEVAMPEGKGWRLEDPALAHKELGFNENTINPGKDLSKADIKELRQYAKALLDNLNQRSNTEAQGAAGRRSDLARDEAERVTKWYKARKGFLENKYHHPIQARRLHHELKNLEALRVRQREFIDRLLSVESSNLFLKIVAVYWGVK